MHHIISGGGESSQVETFFTPARHVALIFHGWDFQQICGGAGVFRCRVLAVLRTVDYGSWALCHRLAADSALDSAVGGICS